MELLSTGAIFLMVLLWIPVIGLFHLVWYRYIQLTINQLAKSLLIDILDAESLNTLLYTQRPYMAIHLESTNSKTNQKKRGRVAPFIQAAHH